MVYVWHAEILMFMLFLGGKVPNLFFLVMLRRMNGGDLNLLLDGRIAAVSPQYLVIGAPLKQEGPSQNSLLCWFHNCLPS